MAFDPLTLYLIGSGMQVFGSLIDQSKKIAAKAQATQAEAVRKQSQIQAGEAGFNLMSALEAQQRLKTIRSPGQRS